MNRTQAEGPYFAEHRIGTVKARPSPGATPIGTFGDLDREAAASRAALDPSRHTA
jgi:hypothetical protein